MYTMTYSFIVRDEDEAHDLDNEISEFAGNNGTPYIGSEKRDSTPEEIKSATDVGCFGD